MPSTNLVQTGILSLISDAGPMAKLVLLILLGASIYCWAIIFTKGRALKRVAQQNQKFLDLFWNGKTIEDILSKTDQFPASPVAAVFKSGVKEFKKLAAEDTNGLTSGKVENIQRALARATNSEIASLEKNVNWLATTASAAPFVGLFGTVWGIMSSFQSIGATGAANLAVVAPGISEALITTATGIAAAIPAVIAYNHFVGQIKRVSVDIDCFSQDFMNIIQRSMISGPRADN
jgi:biopolymer transport protein TolQ